MKSLGENIEYKFQLAARGSISQGIMLTRYPIYTILYAKLSMLLYAAKVMENETINI